VQYFDKVLITIITDAIKRFIEVGLISKIVYILLKAII